MENYKIVTEYINWKATHTQRACISYKIWLERFVEYTKKELCDVNVADVVAFHKHLSVKYSPMTTKLAMIVLKGFFGYLFDQNRCTVNPKYIRTPKVTARSWKPVTCNEFDLMIKTISSKCVEYDFWQLRNLLIVQLLWETGTRVSELCSLNMTDIDPGRQGAIIATRKTDHKRQIFWSFETHQMILRYLKIRADLGRQSEALFVGEKWWSIRLTTRSIERIIKETCHKAGIQKRIVPHSFRHGKAHTILEKHGTVADIAKILGHQEPSSSFTYLELSDVELETRARRFLI